jgi:chromosome segregation ATPase
MIPELQQDLVSLRHDLESVGKEIKKSSEERDGIKLEISVARKELSRVAELQTTLISSLGNKLSTKQREVDNACNLLDDRERKLCEEMDGLEVKARGARTTISTLDEKVRLLQLEIKEYEKTSMSKQVEIDNLNRELVRLKKESDRLLKVAEQVSKLDQQKLALQQELGDMRRRSIQLDIREKRIERMEASLTKREREVGVRENDIGDVAVKAAFMFEKSAELANYSPLP